MIDRVPGTLLTFLVFSPLRFTGTTMTERFGLSALEFKEDTSQVNDRTVRSLLCDVVGARNRGKKAAETGREGCQALNLQTAWTARIAPNGGRSWKARA